MAAVPISSTKKISPTLIRVLVLLGLSVFINYIVRTNLSVAAPLLKSELVSLPIAYLSSDPVPAILQPVCERLCRQVGASCSVAVRDGEEAVMIARAVPARPASVGLGVGESVAYPAYAKIFASHFVERQRGVANSVVGAGQRLGPAFGILFGGTLVARFGWRPFFIVLALVSLLWLSPWLQCMPRTPTCGVLHMKQGPALSEIVRTRSAWGSWIGHFCSNYFLYFLLTWLPFYLVSERHFSVDGMAKVGGSTFLMSALSALLCGRLSDRWICAGATPRVSAKLLWSWE